MLWFVALTFAQPGMVDENMEPAELKSVDELVRDLRGEDASDALFAARELKAQTKSYNKTVARGNPSSVRVLEARHKLAQIEERAAGPCLDLLWDDRMARPCAGLVAELGMTNALPALHDANQPDRPGLTRRALRRAIRSLEDS